MAVLLVSGASSARAQTVPADAGYAQGSEDARVEVIELLDFGCPVCAAFARETYPELRRRYVETGAVRWRAIPFVLGSFRNSSEAARAAHCAAEGGAFWAMHDLLFERRGAWAASRSPEEAFQELAGVAGLNGEAFAQCYRSSEAREQVDAHGRAARRLRVRGTPTFVIDGEMVAGAPSLEDFRTRIDALLAR